MRLASSDTQTQTTRMTLSLRSVIKRQALAKRLASYGLDKIYCSPVRRAIDTARYTADLLQLDSTSSTGRESCGLSWR